MQLNPPRGIALCALLGSLLLAVAPASAEVPIEAPGSTATVPLPYEPHWAFVGDALADTAAPYTAEEVARVRMPPLVDVAGVRAELLARMGRMGRMGSAAEAAP